MSLTKRITLPSRIDIEYWRLAYIGLDPINKTVYFDIHGYANKAAFDSGGTPVETTSLQVSKEQFQASGIPKLGAITKAFLNAMDKLVLDNKSDLCDAVEDDTDVL